MAVRFVREFSNLTWSPTVQDPGHLKDENVVEHVGVPVLECT